MALVGLEREARAFLRARRPRQPPAQLRQADAQPVVLAVDASLIAIALSAASCISRICRRIATDSAISLLERSIKSASRLGGLWLLMGLCRTPTVPAPPHKLEPRMIGDRVPQGGFKRLAPHARPLEPTILACRKAARSVLFFWILRSPVTTSQSSSVLAREAIHFVSEACRPQGRSRICDALSFR